MGDLTYEHAVRDAAMRFVADLAAANGGEVTRDQLQQFTFEGEQIKLRDTGRGFRNPRQLGATLTILTSAKSQYNDGIGDEGFQRYAIRDGELGAGDNRKLRVAYDLQLPLIWFRGVRDGVFVPVMPVFLVDELPATKQYVVALGEGQLLMAPKVLGSGATFSPVEREYVERMTKQRLHQPAFRAMVMHAYATSCAVCALKHGKLLDAAHIVEDGLPKGDPITKNGLALCKIHHAAYDQNILGIRPDLVVVINQQVLEEVDGPMLKHGLQEFHKAPLRVVPSQAADKPDPERLGIRFERFVAAS